MILLFQLGLSDRPLNCQVDLYILMRHHHHQHHTCHQHLILLLQSDNFTANMGQRWFGNMISCWQRNQTGSSVINIKDIPNFIIIFMIFVHLHLLTDLMQCSQLTRTAGSYHQHQHQQQHQHQHQHQQQHQHQLGISISIIISISNSNSINLATSKQH